MTSAPLNSRPFAFDTEFDGFGSIVTPSAFRPSKRAYMPAEVEALVAQARFEAREAALAEADSLQAMAVVEVGRAMAAAIPTLAQVAQQHREHSAGLALAAARVIAASALDRYPEGPLRAALESLGQEIDASPRLVIRAGALDDTARARIEAVCTDAGFSGLVSFREEPGLPTAAFQLEWADGRAEFDPAAAAARVNDVLNAALASEGGHAENVSVGGSL